MLLFVVLRENSCKSSISETDLTQQETIQCCHQSDYTDNCSKQLYKSCRIKLNIATNSIWFYLDHVDMHSNQDENNDQ